MKQRLMDLSLLESSDLACVNLANNATGVSATAIRVKPEVLV